MKRICNTYGALAFLLLMAGSSLFYSCQKEENQNRLNDQKDESVQSIYIESEEFDASSPYYVDEKTKEIINQMSDENHEKLLEEVALTTEEGSFKGGDKPNISCCNLIRVVEQNNPWWVGAEIGDRDSQNATFLLNYRGYDMATGQLLNNTTINLSNQACGNGNIWWWWFGVPIPPNVSLHPTCPDPLVRAEFYLYIQYSNLPSPLLCNFKWKEFPMRGNNPNHNPCQ